MSTTEANVKQYPGIIPSNSSSDALGAAGVFTGEWVNVSYFPAITTAVNTDQSGTLQVQFSPDKTNIDSTTNYSITSGNTENKLAVQRKWMRVVYTNGGTPQTYMRLQSMAGYQDTAAAGGGGSSEVVPFEQRVSEGNETGYEILTVSGNGLASGSGSGSDIWGSGGLYDGFIEDFAGVVYVRSTNANDDAAGSGARTVKVTGLDSVTKNEVSETVALVGSTQVATTQQFYRVNKAEVMTTGGTNNSGGPAAFIVVADSIGLTNRFQNIQAGENQSDSCITTIPNNKTGYLKTIFVSAEINAGWDGTFVVRVKEYNVPEYMLYKFNVYGNKPFDHTFESPLVLPSGSDVSLRCIQTSANQDVYGNMEIILVAN